MDKGLNLEKAKQVLFEALKIGGAVMLRYFKNPGVIKWKGPVSIVTQADKESERRIIKIIKSAFPGHSLISEESPALIKESPYSWIIDPLDGTTNYAHTIPQACVSVALTCNNEALIGGVYDPFRNELFFAQSGKGAYLNGKRIRVSMTAKMMNCVVSTGFPYDRMEKARFYLGFYEGFLRTTQGLRRFGAAALDLSWVACGRYDGFWEFKLSPWDVAAGALIVKEAGGKVTDFSGKAYTLDNTVQTLATNGILHKAMLKVMKGRLKANNEISNLKHQITNKYQIPSTNFQTKPNL